MIYILHQEDKVLIRIQSRKSCLRRTFFDRFCLRPSLSSKNLFSYKFSVHGPFHFIAFFSVLISWFWKITRLGTQKLSNHDDAICLNINEESVKLQIFCPMKPCEIQIEQHQLNSKTVYKKQRTSSHVTTTSQLLDVSLFVSVSTPFLRASSWAPGTPTILSRQSACFCLSRSRSFVLPLVHDDYPLFRHTIFLQR